MMQNQNGSPAILVVVATYNEIENLPKLVPAILNELPSADILVVDDNSPDGTGIWCDEYSSREPHLHCLHRKEKLGLGTALVAALRYSLELDYDFVINMDADFSHNPKYLQAVVLGMQHTNAPLDVMIGSRYVLGGGIEGWPAKRHFMSRGVNLYSRWLLSLKALDCSGGFRCYRTQLLRQIDWQQIRSVGYAFQEEFLWRLQLVGARIGEHPIVFVDRRRGQSKIDWKEAFQAVRVIGRLGIKNWFGV